MDLEDYPPVPFPPPNNGQGHLPPGQAAPGLSTPALRTSRAGASTASPSNPKMGKKRMTKPLCFGSAGLDRVEPTFREVEVHFDVWR